MKEVLAARREADAVEVAAREKATCQEREEAVGVTSAAEALLLLSDVPSSELVNTSEKISTASQLTSL